MMTRQTQRWGRLVGALALTFALAVRWGIPVAGATLVVRADDDLQAAIDRARPGDTLLLEPGATYTGNFVLPDKGGTRPIVIRSGADDRRLPGLAERVGPDDAPLLPKLKSPNSQPVLRTAPGASAWRLFALEFVGNGQAGDMITLGDGSSAQKDVESLPSELRSRPYPGPWRCGEGPEARHRAQQRLDHHSQQLHIRHQSVRPGIAGDCRVEWHRSIHDREQLPRSCGRQHPLWRRRSGHPGTGPERHHHSAEPHHQERRVAWIDVDREEST